MTFFYDFTGSHKGASSPLSKNAIRDVLEADSQDVSCEHTLSKSSKWAAFLTESRNFLDKQDPLEDFL